MTTAVDGATVLSNMAEGGVAWTEQMITKWDPKTRSTKAIFYQSRDEARSFLFAVYNLQETMNRVANGNSHHNLVHLGRLMATAMRRLEREFAEILSYVSSPASSTSEDEGSLHSAAWEHLCAVAECMVSSGYAKECVGIYSRRRRSVVDDDLSRLLLEYSSHSHVNKKLNWKSRDIKLDRWLAAARAIFVDIFAREKTLSDHVFASKDHIRDSCFAEIAGDAAMEYVRFPQWVVSKNKKPSSEKLVLHYLSMYSTIRELWPEIELLFPSKSTTTIKIQSQVETSLVNLAVAARTMISDYESEIQKDPSKSMTAGCTLHPLAKAVMDHLVPLSDFADVLGEVLDGEDSLPPTADGESSFSVSTRFRRLLTCLLSKLDVKAESYKDASKSYLFLSNNMLYVVKRVKESKLADLLGQEWVLSHEKKARTFARSFLKLSWNRVLEVIPEDPLAAHDVDVMGATMVEFNRVFEEARKSQEGLVVLDDEVRSEIKSAIARNLVGPYRHFYERCRSELRTEEGLPVVAVVRYAPEDLLGHLSGLYSERVGGSDSEWSSSGSIAMGTGGSSGKASLWRRWKESR